MPITSFLEKNALDFPNDVALVELNPEVRETMRITWKDYDLTQPEPNLPYRREITWHVFNEKANRCAHYLLERGVRKGDKVGILLMNCLEWLPIYFGILKTGALAVPLNFRYASDEIEYCMNLADISVLFFGPEFIGRMEAISDKVIAHRLLIFVGEGSAPTFSENYFMSVMNYSSQNLFHGMGWHCV